MKFYKFRSDIRTPDVQEQSLSGQQPVTRSSPVLTLAVTVTARNGHDNRWEQCERTASFFLMGFGSKKLRGLSPRANYTDRAAAAGRRS